MNGKRVVLNIPIWRVPPIEHADRGPCVCDQCWEDFRAWSAANLTKLAPPRRGTHNEPKERS